MGGVAVSSPSFRVTVGSSMEEWAGDEDMLLDAVGAEKAGCWFLLLFVVVCRCGVELVHVPTMVYL